MPELIVWVVVENPTPCPRKGIFGAEKTNMRCFFAANRVFIYLRQHNKILDNMRRL